MARDTRPFVLMILDGWGVAPAGPYNAISQARTPAFERFYRTAAHTLLETSGEAVGLPAGQMGNSEVGHLNIGSGRVVYQDSVRISKSIRDGDFFHNPALSRAMDMARGGALHLYGLISDGGVHSRPDHLYALLRMARGANLKHVFVHACLDGRDTPPRSAITYLRELQEEMQRQGVGEIATVMGRYYAMDRDNRWERTAQAYAAMVEGQGREATDAMAAVERSYREDVADEFVVPVVLRRPNGEPVGRIRSGDSVICFNFRADRVRQMTRALIEADFHEFPRASWPPVHYTCMTQYSSKFDVPIAFQQQKLTHLMANVFADSHIRNARISETEKYAHVTYFLNGGIEEPFACEDRILIPSPKVATYDLQPEMSAGEITEATLKKIREGQTDVCVLNFANADMVGHTGVFPAAVKAVETLDTCVGRIVEAIQEAGGWAMITADHGNIEQMFDPVTNSPHTAHTTNPVPLIVVDPQFRGALREGGALCDIVPTILGVMGLPQPAEMTGTDLRR